MRLGILFAGSILDDPALLCILLVIPGAVFLMLGCAWIVKMIKRIRSRRMDRENERKIMALYERWRQDVQRTGEIPQCPTSVLLAPGEECLWCQEYARLYEVRAVRHSIHSHVSSGASGVRFGYGSSISESSDEWREVAKGELCVTNRQVYFAGDKQGRKIPLEKIAKIEAEPLSLYISSESRAKSMKFSNCPGYLIRDIVLSALGHDVF